jgi:nicotinamide mononucleotide transporter
MDPLEITAVAFGVLSVWLSTRQHIASWPTALVNTALYLVIFQRAGIYANSGLQGVYFVLSCYGWYQWKYGGQTHTGVVVTRTTARVAVVLIGVAASSAVLLGAGLARFTDATIPWLDAGTTAVSLVAQWMMTRKLLESWLIWIAVDVVYVWMYFSQGMRPTAGLYAAFLVLAIVGYFSWRTSLRARLAAESLAAESLAAESLGVASPVAPVAPIAP